MSQISSHTAKLELLKQTHDIEEKERERHERGIEKRKEKYNAVKTKNDDLCLKAANDVAHRQDEAAHQELLEKMTNDTSLKSLSPITNVLNSSQGKLFRFINFTVKKRCIYRFTASMNKVKRVVVGNSDTLRANFEKLKCNEYYMKMVMVMLKEIKSDMKQFTFHMRMDSTDLSEFFPLKNEQVIFSNKNVKKNDQFNFNIYH